MMNSLRYALVVLLASSLLVSAVAGTTTGRDRAATDSKYSSLQSQSSVSQLDRAQTHSQLEKMSCSELRVTYQRGIQAVQNSDLPSERKRNLIQRGTFVYNMYKFRKGC